ncbi:MAG: hypothetical protein NT031_09765 [Planctomycetota bacterium]|nr:hypothetical protein [Planctomycetota bacterium]
MSNPIVIAYHLVFTGYGWWLPNDPRGSMSKSIRHDVLADLGELHYGRKAVQPASGVIGGFYDRAPDLLKHDLSEFSAREIAEIAASFGGCVASRPYTVYACAIMGDHVHLLIRKHRDRAEEMIDRFQSVSRLRLRDLGLRPCDHPIWGGPGWKVFLDHPDEIPRTIRYIEDNPVKQGLPRQTWEFVKAYDGWPLHEGHSANSPYVRRMKGQ